MLHHSAPSCAIKLAVDPANLEPVDRAFNIAVNQIASQIFPTGFDVGEDAPATLDDLRQHVASTGRMLVYNWASEQTIFADRETNWAFRAWHDWSHLQSGGEFTVPGEIIVAQRQIDDLSKLYGHGATMDRFARLIWSEVLGQVLYADNHAGEFPEDQRAFFHAYFARPDLAVSHSSKF